MKARTRIILKAILCILLAAGAYLWANASMQSIYDFRSPLDENPPLPGPALAQAPRGRVVVVLMDALRVDTAADPNIMPVLAGLRSQGASASMHSRPPSFSTPGYGVLLTGAWPDLSGAPAFNLDYDQIPAISQDTIFAAAQRANLKTALAAYNYFEKLLPADVRDASFFTAGEDDAADREVLAAALPWLDSGAYSLVLIHLDQLDYAGHHQGGAAGAGWNAAAARVDAMLGQILQHMDLSHDTIIVLSDHGQIDQGGHGGTELVTLREPFVMAGAGVIPGVYEDINMTDFAPTLAALLGTSLPAAAQGQPLSQMLSFDIPQGIVTVQQRNLLASYSTAIGVPPNPTRLAAAKTWADFENLLESVQVTRRNNERGLRAVLAAALLAAIFWSVRPWKLGNALGWLAALGIPLAFLLRYFLGTRSFSYSSLGGAADLVQLGATGVIPAMILLWLLLAWRQGWLRQTRSQAAENSIDFALAAGLLWLLPIAAHFAFNGALARWLLPDFDLQYVFVLSAIALLFTLAAGLLLTAMAAFITRRRVAA